jgi:ribosomal-protein-alanine N-acetyltransferase
MKIERVGVELLSEIAEIEHMCFTDPWSAASFTDLQGNRSVFFVCAREDAKSPVLGYVVAWFVFDEAEIGNLAVRPECRRRGVGSALLDAALAEAARRGVAALYLEVRDSNHSARRLYESRGFVEVGRRKSYYRRPTEDALILRCTVVSGVVNADY